MAKRTKRKHTREDLTPVDTIQDSSTDLDSLLEPPAFLPPTYGVKLPAFVQQHQHSFMASLEPILEDANKIINVESYFSVNGKRFFHIKGAMEFFRTEYNSRIPPNVGVGVTDDDQHVENTRNWLNRLLGVGKDLGELRLASTVLEREVPELWSKHRDSIEESRAYLEHYIGACIAVIQSNYDKTISDEFYSQYDALLDLFKHCDEHRAIAKASKIAAFSASHEFGVLQSRLRRLSGTLGLTEHIVHGNKLYLPSTCVPTVRNFVHTLTPSIDDAVSMVRHDSFYISETAIITIDDARVDRGKGHVAGLLRITDTANELKARYASNFENVQMNDGDPALAKALHADFSEYVDKYAAIAFINRLDKGAYEPVKRAMEDVLVYHIAAFNSFFDRRIEHALQIQAELGHDASWVRNEFEGASLFLADALRSRNIRKSKNPGDCLGYAVNGLVRPSSFTASTGVALEQKDDFLDGIDKGKLMNYESSARH